MSNENTPAPAPVSEDEEENVHHAGIGSRVRRYFLAGLVAAAPLAITTWLAWSFITWVDDLVRPFIPLAYRPETYFPIRVPGFGLIIGFIALTLLGALTANLVGRTLVEAGEMLLERMPVIRPLYRGLKQVFETLFSKSGSTFRKVGLVEFPSPGMWSIVFLSATPGTEISDRLPGQEEHVAVFLPCTPNPTTGFFFYVKKRDVIEVDIPVEAAAKLIMSAGVIQPESSEPQRRLAAFAEAAKAARAARMAAPAN